MHNFHSNFLNHQQSNENNHNFISEINPTNDNRIRHRKKRKTTHQQKISVSQFGLNFERPT